MLAGAGHGAAFGALVDQIVTLAPSQHASSLSGMITTAIQLAIVTGIAALGSLYLSGDHARTRAASPNALSSVFVTAAALALVGIPIAARIAVITPNRRRPAALTGTVALTETDEIWAPPRQSARRRRSPQRHGSRMRWVWIFWRDGLSGGRSAVTR